MRYTGNIWNQGGTNKPSWWAFQMEQKMAGISGRIGPYSAPRKNLPEYQGHMGSMWCSSTAGEGHQPEVVVTCTPFMLPWAPMLKTRKFKSPYKAKPSVPTTVNR